MGAVERTLIASDNCATTLHLIAAIRGAVNGLSAGLIEQINRWFPVAYRT